MRNPASLIRRLPPTARVLALTALAGGAAALLWCLQPGGAADSRLSIPWWALAAGFVVTELCVVHLHFRRGAYTLTLGELPLVVGLTFATPAEIAPAWVLGAGIVLLVGRCPPSRLAFNLAQLALTAGVAVTIFNALAGGAGPLDVRAWGATAAAVLVADAASALLVALAMSIAGDRAAARQAPRLVAIGLGVAAVNVGLGLGAVALLAARPAAVLLLAGPAAAVLLAYRAYQAERAKHLGLEFLYEASRLLGAADDRAGGVAGVLGLAAETFRAEVAEVCLAGDDGSAPARVTVGPGERLEVLEPLDPEVSADLLACTGEDPRARIVEADAVGPALRAHLERRGIRSAMLAGLPGDRRVTGALVVGNRVGVGGAFDQDDLRLCGTLAAHLGSALGEDHLARRVSELHAAQEQLYHRASHDGLTGLPNRVLFMDRVRHALARRTGNVAVIYVDLDDFKPVNDTLGHEAGDQVLCVTAERLRASLRPADTPARLGGDEFAVLLCDIEPRDAGTVADRILRNLAEPFDLAGRVHAIHASVGVALGDAGRIDADALVRNADAAMYVTKHGDKRGYSVHGVAAR